MFPPSNQAAGRPTMGRSSVEQAARATTATKSSPRVGILSMAGQSSMSVFSNREDLRELCAPQHLVGRGGPHGSQPRQPQDRRQRQPLPPVLHLLLFVPERQHAPELLAPHPGGQGNNHQPHLIRPAPGRPQITARSSTSTPSANLPGRRPDTSNAGSRPTIRSAHNSPTAGACMNPWPEKPQQSQSPGTSSDSPTMPWWSGVTS